MENECIYLKDEIEIGMVKRKPEFSKLIFVFTKPDWFRREITLK
jgi:hypothetical protein